MHRQNDITQLGLEKMLRQKLRTFVTNPLGVLEKYRDKLIYRLTGRLQPIHNEDYDKHWNYVSFKNKVVLDLGADYGSTASYFLYRGAKRVVAVEGNEQFAKALWKNFKKNNKVTPIELFINSSSDIDNLINQYTPDVIKVDIEGCELSLLSCQNIEQVKEWLIECHSPQIHDKIKTLFLQKGFKAKTIEYGKTRGNPDLTVLVAVK